MGSTFQFGLACFVLFFGLSQLFGWMRQFNLPLPIFILGGAFLAIVSNFDRRAGLPFSLIDEVFAPPAKEIKPPAPAQPEGIEPSQTQILTPQSQKPVSFKVSKPEQSSSS
jgi:hypothetical protein